MVRGLVYHYAVADEISVAKSHMYEHGILAGSDLYEHLTGERFTSFLLTHGEMFSSCIYRSRHEIRMNLDRLWTYEASQMVASIKSILSKQPRTGIDSLIHTARPVMVEQKIDGSALGLSPQLSVGALGFDSIILDLKTGEYHLSTTSYALVYESIFEYPINVGYIVYVNF